MILDLSRLVFRLLLPASLLLSVFFYRDKMAEESIPTQNGETTKLKTVIRTIESIVTLVIFIGGAILVHFKYKSWAWICIALAMPVYLNRIAGTYVSVGIIGKVVQSTKTDKLSVREHWAIETTAYTLYFLDVYKLPAKLLDHVANFESIPVSDCLYITLYVSLFFLYVFLSCAVLPVPLSFLAKLLIKANALIRDKTNIFKIGQFFIMRINQQVTQHPLCAKAIEATKSKHIICCISVWILSPIIMVLDVCFLTAKILWSLMNTCVGYVFLILRLIKRTTGKATAWINNLSDRHLVATSFRVALIATLAITVVSNRYTPLLKEYESSTGVLEFVASAIIIPVIFEWISSTKSKRNNR